MMVGHSPVRLKHKEVFMGIFDFLKQSDINKGVADWQNTKGALLVDVRAAEEYREGHIQGSHNVPLHALMKIVDLAPDKQTPLFVYCLSGGRSAQAVSALKRMGYGQAVNIGGIMGYRGKVVR